MINKKIFRKNYYYQLLKKILNKKEAFIQLQLFSKAEDEGRTEEASTYKQRKARKEGKVAYSQELVSAIVILASFISLFFVSDFIFSRSKNLFIMGFQQINEFFDENRLKLFLKSGGIELFTILSPIFITTVVFAIIANVVQVGFHFTSKAIKLDFKKVSFTSNKMFSKIFFSRQTIFNLFKAVFKLILVISAIYLVIDLKLNFIVSRISMETAIAFPQLLNLAFIIFLISCFIFLILSIPDYFFQKQEHLSSLKMSRHELKEERKETDGDPQIKQRLKEKQRNLLNQNFVEEVPKADIVITNPNHYAIAIKYDSQLMFAPLVVAKGKDYTALRIKEIAIENEIHIVENKILAKSLYLAVQVGDEIPEEFYQAIAEILAFVIKAKEAIKG